MKFRTKFFAFSLAILSAVTLAPTAALAQTASDSVVLTTTTAINIAGQVLEPGTYVIRPITEQGVLVIENVNAGSSKKYLLPTSVSASAATLTPTVAAVNIERDATGAQFVRSLYFPHQARTYTFSTTKAVARGDNAIAAVKTIG